MERIAIVNHTDGFDSTTMSALTPNVPDYQPILQTFRNKFGELLTTFGINNPAIDKRERVLKAEAEFILATSINERFDYNITLWYWHTN